MICQNLSPPPTFAAWASHPGMGCSPLLFRNRYLNPQSKKRATLRFRCPSAWHLLLFLHGWDREGKGTEPRSLTGCVDRRAVTPHAGRSHSRRALEWRGAGRTPVVVPGSSRGWGAGFSQGSPDHGEAAAASRRDS